MRVILSLIITAFSVLFAMIDGAVGMWTLGHVFPVLSYWNWVFIAFFIIACMGSGLIMHEIRSELD